MNLNLSFDQAADLIAAVGSTNTVMLQGQPGVGKTSVFHELAKRFPDYHPAYIDCTNLDLGDVAMPVVDRDEMVTHYAPNARFGVARSQTRPVLLMLDELTKAAKPVLNMLLPTLLEHRVGDVPLPTGSIVFATGNLASDGVGDNLPAHAYNRMTVVGFANPTFEQWAAWAVQNNIHTAVLHFAHEHREVFDRYDLIDNAKGNPYIFNPLTGNVRAYCSPRSLAKASNLLHVQDQLGAALLPALAGTIGEPAARMLEASVAMETKVPTSAAILADPAAAPLPGDISASYYLALRCATQSSAKTIERFVAYVLRWKHAEAQTLFATAIAGDKEKVTLALRTTNFRTLASSCGKYF